MADNIEQWAYYSQNKNKKLQDFNSVLYQFISTDLIKIEITSISVNPQNINNQMISLKISVSDQQEFRVFRSLFSQLCTIKDLEETVLQFCGIPLYQNDIRVDISLQGRTFDRQLTLQQLQIQTDTSVQATLQRAPSAGIDVSQQQQPSTIRLLLEIQDGLNISQYIKDFSVNDMLYQVRMKMLELCDLRLNLIIDIYISERPYNSDNLLRSTLNELRLSNDIKIVGKIRM